MRTQDALGAAIKDVREAGAAAVGISVAGTACMALVLFGSVLLGAFDGKPGEPGKDAPGPEWFCAQLQVGEEKEYGWQRPSGIIYSERTDTCQKFVRQKFYEKQERH